MLEQVIHACQSGNGVVGTAAWLRDLALECGADDAGVIRVEREELDDQRDHIMKAMPGSTSVDGSRTSGSGTSAAG